MGAIFCFIRFFLFSMSVWFIVEIVFLFHFLMFFCGILGFVFVVFVVFFVFPWVYLPFLLFPFLGSGGVHFAICSCFVACCS